MENKIFTLEGYQRSFLKRLAHHLKPVVMLGQAGLTPEVVKAVDQALTSHELIKLKFQDFKADRKVLSEAIALKADAQFISLVGNILILFRHNYDLEERIRLPKR